MVEKHEETVLLVEREDRRWWPLVVSVGASVLSAVLAATLALTVASRNAERGKEARRDLQRQVCSLVVALGDNYREVPPTTPLGQRNAASLEQLRNTLGCDGVIE